MINQLCDLQPSLLCEVDNTIAYLDSHISSFFLFCTSSYLFPFLDPIFLCCISSFDILAHLGPSCCTDGWLYKNKGVWAAFDTRADEADNRCRGRGWSKHNTTWLQMSVNRAWFCCGERRRELRNKHYFRLVQPIVGYWAVNSLSVWIGQQNPAAMVLINPCAVFDHKSCSCFQQSQEQTW